MASRRGVSVLCQALMQRASATCPAGGMLAAKALSASSQWAVVSAPGGLASARALWTSAPALSANLLKSLKDEVDYEQKNYRKPDEIAAGPPAPFTLTEEPGDTLLTLTRKYKDEDIAVNLQVNNQAPSDEGDGENEDGESLNIVVFNVSVTKGSRSLVFECESDGTYVGITHLSAEPKDGFDSDSMYTGPVFEELDDTLQRHWKTYLEERGVVPELGEYLRHLVYDKEQREYVAWLQSVHAFLAK